MTLCGPQRLCARLGLETHFRVLDVGTGPGGSAIHMASRYGCHVTGIDLSANMVTVALQRQASLPPAVSRYFSVLSTNGLEK